MGIKDLIEHLTQKQVDDYNRQQLNVAELLSVSDHLDECEVCRQRIEYALNDDATFFALRSEVFGEALEAAPLHLSAEQAADYVDGNLTGETLQMVSDHLTACEQCALAVGDLQTFKKQIATSLEREYHPATESSEAEGWWRQAIAFLRAPFGQSPGLAFGAAFAILLLAVTGWLIWRTLQQRAPQQEIVNVPPAPPQPAPQPQPAPVPVVAELKDGGARLTLDREGNLSGADELPPAYQSMLKDALASQRIERSAQLRGLVRPPSSLMGTDKDETSFSVIDPVGKVVMSDRPTFRWSPMEGASEYVVEIYDSKFNLVATSPQLTSRSWTSPALARGQVYSWQVKATKDGQEFTAPRPPAPQAAFRILDRAKANELAKARRAYSSSHLTLGLLYAEAGLLKEAEQEFRLLQKANPDSEIARSLLRHVQALQR